MPSPDQYVNWLERDIAQFLRVIRQGDLTLPVASCPGWSTEDLTGHLGGIHRWAAAAMRTGSSKPREPAPATSDLADWFAEGGADLVDLLRAVDPDAPTWTFGPHPRMMRFWHRRQAHETAMHLWDAQATQGWATGFDTELAVDGVQEIVEVMFPRQVRLDRIEPLSVGIKIELDELPGVELKIAGDGIDPTAPTGAVIKGTAVDVLLALWRRGAIANLRITGDPGLAVAVIGSAITP